MFGICFIHAGTNGYYGENSENANSFVIHFKYMLAVSVDIFAFISGWFGVTFRLNKFLKIIGLSLFCGIVSFLISHYFFYCAPLNFKVLIHYCATNWYFVGYLILMLVSPLINAGLERFKSENLKNFLLPFILLCIWQFASSVVSQNSATGLGRDYFSRFSFVTIVNIYIIGRLCKKSDFLKKIKTWLLVLIALICACFTAFPPFHFYTSPFCVIEAICIFELFRRIKIPFWLGKVSVFLAPSMFSILLLHREIDFCKAIFFPLEGEILGSLNPFFSVFIAALILFTVCLFIDLIRRFLLFIFYKCYTNLKEKKLERNG